MPTIPVESTVLNIPNFLCRCAECPIDRGQDNTKNTLAAEAPNTQVRTPKIWYAADGVSAEPSKGPVIELKIREVQNAKGIFQHGFTVITDSYGRETIMTGLTNNMFTGDLNIIEAPYTQENEDLFGRDARKYVIEHKTIMRIELNNDAELSHYLHKAHTVLEESKSVSADKAPDYDVCLTERCWGGNSNTVQGIIYAAWNIEIKIPNGVSLPGIKGKFYNGILDDFVMKFSRETKKQCEVTLGSVCK